MWRLCACGHPQASTIDNKLLDANVPMTDYKPWAPVWQGREVGTFHTEKIRG